MSEEKGLTPYETREILFYKTENGEVRVEILLFQENLWLTQAKMAELFEVQKAAISKHLKNIFESGELSEDSVVSKMETTAADGKRYQTNYYNLDAIIAVGYRVNSKKATMFRIWANKVLKEFIIKGYVMDDARLREPESFFGKDYFEEQLERIRDIRASERRFYQKITDIYSQCSADYDVESPITKEFFATVQNKLHYAVTVPFPVSWTVKMKKKQKETQDILSYHTQAAGCSDKARAKASGGRQPIEECGRTGL